MESVISRVVALIEKFFLPIALIVGFLIYQKFSSLFSGKDNEEEEKAEKQQVLEQNEALFPSYESTKGKTKAQAAKITKENADKAKLFSAARTAEKLVPLLSTSTWNVMRSDKLFEVANYMKQHKVSLTQTATQYKKLTAQQIGGSDDLYSDLRYTLGTKYASWLAIAGTTK